MLDNLIFSLGVAAPIFLVMLTGYILKKTGWIDEHFVKTANRLIFYIALPIKLFNDVRAVDLSEMLDFGFYLFIMAGVILSVVFAWMVSFFLIKDQSLRGSFIQGSFRGNFLYVGFSLIENITGTLGAKAPMMLAMTMPWYNILAVIIFSFNNPDREVKVSVKDSILELVKNPMVIGIVAGFIAALVDLEVPSLPLKTASYLEVLATPLALLSIGASVDVGALSKNLVPALQASALKLIVIPVLAILAAAAFGFGSADIILVYVLFGVPTATVSYIIAVSMKGDGELASSIIMATTLLSVITMTGFIFVFRTLGMI
ncbi:AEC family transporter [Alkalibacter mobilis]|uniref:AEC family transporter n=1 Tax=Alkalibacter mobilis TaxID=2787712 RepID=UPI0018A0F029|nr:AEC family transporter [Alkalibacter mobilis]MBF7096622.1 AEC family transporter [Alkalibacter mobilis]